MNWLSIIFVYLPYIRCEEDLFEIERVFFLENDFWCGNQDQLKTDNGYLYEVELGLDHKNGGFDSFVYSPKKCYSLKSTNLGYLVLKDSMIKDIDSFLEPSEDKKKVFKFRYFFIDDLNEINYNYDFLYYKGKIHEHVTHKLLEKFSENIINLKDDKHIYKEKFKVILPINLLMFYEFAKNLGEKKNKLNIRKKDENFELFYFKKHSECFEHLKDFIKNLYCLKLQKDDEILKLPNLEFLNTTTIRVSKLKEDLKNLFICNLKLNDIKFNEIWGKLFDECFCYLENEILNNKILFPINGKYTILYYIGQISNLIYEHAKEKQEKHNCLAPFKMINNFKTNLGKLPLTVMKTLCETEFVPNHFFKLLGKEIKKIDDYSNIDKIIIDYYNMLNSILSPYNELPKPSRVPLICFLNISTDNYFLKIVNGIKIKTNYFVKIKEIKGFNDRGEEVIMVKDTDYFIDELNRIYCPSVVLKKKNIYEIELISSNYWEKNKKFNINKYLNI